MFKGPKPTAFKSEESNKRDQQRCDQPEPQKNCKSQKKTH